MARIKASLPSVIATLSPDATAALSLFVEALVESQTAADLKDIEPAVRTRRTRKAAEAEPAAKPAGRRRRAEAVEEEPAKPARGRRRAAAVEEEEEAPARKPRRTAATKEAAAPAKAVRKPRKPKVEPFDEAPTMDDCYEFLDGFDTETLPEGGIRDLTPLLKAYGVDTAEAFADVTTRAEKTEAMGVMLAALQTLEAKLLQVDLDDLGELADELDVDNEIEDLKPLVQAIIEALNDNEGNADDDGDDDTADEPDADEEPVAKRKPRRRAAEPAEDDELDGLDDIDDLE